MIYIQEEHRDIQEDINKWRGKSGAIDAKGWYPYGREAVKRIHKSWEEEKTQVSASKGVNNVVKFGERTNVRV